MLRLMLYCHWNQYYDSLKTIPGAQTSKHLWASVAPVQLRLLCWDVGTMMNRSITTYKLLNMIKQQRSLYLEQTWWVPKGSCKVQTSVDYEMFCSNHTHHLECGKKKCEKYGAFRISANMLLWSLNSECCDMLQTRSKPHWNDQMITSRSIFA